MVEEPPTVNDFVNICEINGKDSVGFYVRFAVPLGRNTVTVRGNTSNGMYDNPTVLTFTAEEGHTYVLKYETSPLAHLWDPSSWKGRGTYHAWIDDKATGQKVDVDSLQQHTNSDQLVNH